LPVLLSNSFWFLLFFHQVATNVCVYETFGISKHFPIKLQLLLIRAETLDKPLSAKCFIHVVVCSLLFIYCCLIINYIFNLPIKI
jgi:hypothetical protein